MGNIAKKVLIVDDMMYMRKRLRDFLEGMGFQVVGEAENGNFAITRYITLQPDLVLMDVTMPEKNGLEALAEIMRINSNAVVIIVSGLGQTETVQNAVRLGAKNYIIKPFKEEALQKVLSVYL